MNEIEVKKSVGKKIREYRKALNLTQTKLGEIIGINQRQVTLIENGHSIPKLPTMVKMANLFRCSVKDFFNGDSLAENTSIKHAIKSLLDGCDTKQLEQIYAISKIICKNESGLKFTG